MAPAVKTFIAPVTRFFKVSGSCVELATLSKIFIILFMVAPSALSVSYVIELTTVETSSNFSPAALPEIAESS